jgi:hypothetical protein
MAMRDKYGLDPKVFHTDKDFAKIGARKSVWPHAVHQICAWHRDRAVGERLSKNKLSTVIYNAADVIKVYGTSFVNSEFRPQTQRPNFKNTGEDAWDDGPDGEEPEPDVAPVERAQVPVLTDPNTMCIPLLQLQRQWKASQGGGDRAHDGTGEAEEPGNRTDDAAEDQHGGLQTESESSSPATVHQAGSKSCGLKIRIPAPGQPRGVGLTRAAASGGVGASTASNPEEELETAGVGKQRKPRRLFCPKDLHEEIKKMMTRHQDAHPLIPGYAKSTADGIRWWATKQMYQFCERHNLPEVWAYMWGCWYRPGRWELWARSTGPTVPRLKTTMICESQYVETLATEVVERG